MQQILTEKAMATHSSSLAWKIPWVEEPGRLQSMGSQRVRQDWPTSFSLITFMLWRRKWQPTPVFLPGKSQGQGSLVCCRLWGHTKSDTTEATQQQQQILNPTHSTTGRCIRGRLWPGYTDRPKRPRLPGACLGRSDLHPDQLENFSNNNCLLFTMHPFCAFTARPLIYVIDILTWKFGTFYFPHFADR